MRLFSLAVFLLFLAGGATGQSVPADTVRPPDTLKIPDTVVVPESGRKPDTILYVPSGDTSALAQLLSPADLETDLSQPPTIALFKSMVIPGWGQIGNRKYVKAGVIVGLQSWFLIEAFHYGGQASDFKRQFNAATDITTRNTLHNLYLDRRGERNKYYWFYGITTFLSMFDAYVDAHLSGSPTEKRNRPITIDATPDLRGGAQVRLALNLR